MTKITKALGALLLLLSGPALALDTVTITGSVTKPAGSSDSELDACELCEVTIEYVGTNDLTAETLVITDTPSVFYTDGDGDWTTAPLKLLQGGNYRFRFRDPAWPQAGIFLDVTKTAATCVAPCSATFSSLTTVNVAEGADVSALDHGSLSGLGGDHDSEYASLGGEAGYSGTHDFSGATVSGIAYGDLAGVPATFAPASHTIASHSDTTATGAELETLTDGSDADSLHTHGGLDDWSDSGTVVSIQSGRDLAVGASVSVDNSTGTVDASAYTVGGVALASTDLSDGVTVTNLGDTIEASEISDLAAGTDITADLEEESHGSEHGEAGGDPIPLSTFELADLGDVSASAPSSGQALAWGGSAWEPTTITGSVSALDDLSDVAVATPAGGDVLVHDGLGDFANVSVSGDATLAANGALSLASGSVDTAELAAGAVTNTEIAAAAGISLSKIEDSGTAGLFLQSGGGGGDPAYGTIVTGDLPGAVLLSTEIDSESELESVTGLSIFTSGDGALADDDLSDDSIDALSDVDTTTAAPTSGQVLKWDGVGDWSPSADDDVPESGDFAAAADLEADGSLSADVVGAAELDDGDYGDVSFAAGVISIDTGAVGTDEIATDGVGSAEIAANSVGASELADDAVDPAAMSDADYGDFTVALGSATLDANTVAGNELAATSVVAGSYTFTALTVDEDGRITAASSGTDDDSPDSDAEVPDAITVGVGGTVAAAATVSVEAAEISDLHAGTDITGDLEEEAHASEHENGGADEISVAGLSGQLADAQPLAVHKDGAAATGTRAGLNFLDTSPITVALADDSLNGRVDVTIACPTCSTDSYALSVQEGDAELTGSATALDFGAGFDVTETPTGEANIVLDYTEDPVDLSGSEVTGTLPAASVGNGLTDAQVSDAITVGSGGSVAAGALPSTVVYENGTHTMSGSFDFSTATVTVAGDEWVDADVSNAITVDNYLPLSGGTVTGNVSASAGVTFDGIDLSAINFTDLAGTASDAQVPDTITIDGSANVSNASLQAEVMRTDTTETVASIHTYTAAPDFNITGVPFTMGAGVTGTVTRLDADLLDGEHASAFADASHAHAGEDVTSGTVADARIAATLTRDSEWDTAAEINAATTDDDFVTGSGTHTVSGALTLSGSVDAGGGTVEIPNSTTLPVTCAVGDVYMDTDATSGQRLYLCEGANTWAVQGDGDGGSTTLDVAYDNTGGTGNRVIDLDEGNVKFDLEDASNDYHVVVDNTTTGTMDRGIQVGVSGAGGVITDAVDVSAAGIVNAIDIGANNIATDAATISSDELEILDNGIDPADLDDGDYGDFTITGGVASLDANTVAASEMADDAIGPAEMADGDFGDFTVATNVATLDADTVGTSEIVTDGVGADEIAAGAVGTSEIATDGVGADEIASGAVGADEIGDDVIDWDDIADSMTLDADTTVAVDEGEELIFSSDIGDVSIGDPISGAGTDGLLSLEVDQAMGAGDLALSISTTNTISSTVLARLSYTNAATSSSYLMDAAVAGGGTINGINLSATNLSRALNLGDNTVYVSSTELTAAEIAALDDGIGPTELTDGDYGDFTLSGALFSLDNDVVGAAELANGDYGDVSISAGVISLDANTVDTSELDLSISPSWTGDHDFGGGTLQVPNSATLPATCEVGDSYMDTDADSGSRWYLCESSNTWIAQGASAESNDLETDDPPNVQDDEVYVGNGAGSGVWVALADSDGAGLKLTYDTTTNAFAAGTDDDVPESGDFGAAGDLEADGTISADAVALTTDTTGDYVASFTAGAGLSGDASGEGSTPTLATASGEAGFLADGGVTSLVCGSSNQGKAQVLDDGSIEYCDGATTSVLQSGFLDADGTDDDVPESGDFGNATDLEADGSLSADVVAAAEMADADHGDVSWSGGVATVENLQCAGCVAGSELADADLGDVSVSSGSITLDADVVTRTEIDESLLSIQSHATDCTALTCDAGSDGELCLEQDDDQVYVCDGSGSPAWASVGGASTAFSDLTGGTNTGAAMVVGTGASLAASGSGTIAATTAAALAANGSNCSAGQAAGGVDDAGVAEDCTAYLQNVAEDTTPQLGGELDAQGNSIIGLADVTFRTGASGGTLRTGTSAADKFILQAYDVDGAAYVNILEVDAGNTVVADLYAGTTLGGASIQTGTDDDVPESGDFGAAADLEADGSLSADVVAAAEMADADHGDVSWSGGVASIDAGVVGRNEIDETQLSAQTHATDCTALTCDAGSDGEMCFEQDADTWYVCDGSGSPAWAKIGGAVTSFSTISTGTNTTATMTVGTGASIVASGSGSITATAVAADSVALSTDTTGNYVATVADAGNSTITVSGSGSEGAGVTLDAVDLNCTDCIGTTEIADSYVLNSGDTLTGDLTLDDGVTDSPAVTFINSAGQQTSVYQDFGTGSLYWETDATGTTVIAFENIGTGDSQFQANTLTAPAGDSAAGAVYAAGMVGVGSTLAASAACIANDGADRIFHDTDCDETKDAGEEYVDINTRTEEQWWRSGSVCYQLATGGATADASDETGANPVAWGAGFIFPDASDTSITCVFPMPGNFDTSGSVQIQLRGHVETSPGGTADVDFEIRSKEVAAAEFHSTTWGSWEAQSAGELDVDITQFQQDRSDRTTWFTITETLVADDELWVQILRDGNDATHDDSSDDFRLDSVGLKWTEILE